jgi:hypothetical protein
MAKAESEIDFRIDDSRFNRTEGGIMKRIATIAIGSLLSLGLITLEMAAQNQTQSNAQSSSSASSSGTSLGDYARHIRKNSPSAEKSKVFDNDNLPKDDKLSIVGTPSDSSAPANAADDSSGSDSGSGDNKGSADAKAPADSKSGDQSSAEKSKDQSEKDAAAKQWEDKISTQKDAVNLDSRELDVLQREYQLRAAAFYADAGNRLRNQAAWDQEDAKYKEQIADKQKTLDEAKQKLDDLQEQARKAGMPSSVSQQ